MNWYDWAIAGMCFSMPPAVVLLKWYRDRRWQHRFGEKKPT